MNRALAAAAGAVIVVAMGCAPTITPLPPERERPAPTPPPPPPPAQPVDRARPEPSPVSRVLVRVALATAAESALIDAPGQWEAVSASGRIAFRAEPGERWRAARASTDVVFVGPGGRNLRTSGSVTIRPARLETVLRFDARGYRGELSVAASEKGLLVVNTLDVEQYLRSVVPLEIGNRPAAEAAAAEAQAIAARSYAYVRVRSRRAAPYDLLPDVTDQAYSGTSAERPATDNAVRATAGMGLFYSGQVVDAPYHSTCGGRTAAVSEVWQRQRDLPYLAAVSDRVPGSDRHWCDGSANFAWTRTMPAAELNAVIARYLRTYSAGAPANPGVARQLTVSSRTPSGRVATLTVVTARGRYELRGNDIRFVFRAPTGRILNSTNFSVTTSRDGSGAVRSAVFRGNGNGHGIGMCQWGAIGRARAGFSARDILAAYYPGTTVALVNPSDLRTVR